MATTDPYRAPELGRHEPTLSGLEAVHASADPSTVGPAAQDALRALRGWGTDPARASALREYIRRFQAAYGQRLTIDGVYGRDTRAALSAITDVPVADMPPLQHATRPTRPTRPERPTSTTTFDSSTPTTTTPAPRATPNEPPARLVTAIALARWTAAAVEQDSTAATVLRSLNDNSAVRAVRNADAAVAGDVGRVPDAPDTIDITTRARAAWERVREAGASARRELDAQARSAVSEGERALREVRRRMDAETNAAAREALWGIEQALTAILRPLSRGVATAVSPLAGPALLIGGALLLMYVSKNK